MDFSVYLRLKQALMVPSFRDLRRDRDRLEQILEGNPFHHFFDLLSMAITTGHADDEDDEDDTDSTITGSSHEYQSEIYLELALKAFVEAILRNLGDRVSSSWVMRVSVPFI